MIRLESVGRAEFLELNKVFTGLAGKHILTSITHWQRPGPGWPTRRTWKVAMSANWRYRYRALYEVTCKSVTSGQLSLPHADFNIFFQWNQQAIAEDGLSELGSIYSQEVTMDRGSSQVHQTGIRLCLENRLTEIQQYEPGTTEVDDQGAKIEYWSWRSITIDMLITGAMDADVPDAEESSSVDPSGKQWNILDFVCEWNPCQFWIRFITSKASYPWWYSSQSYDQEMQNW
jgi:hypothetical protein